MTTRTERAGRARRRERATTSGWSTTSTAGWRRRGCCGRIRDRRRSRFRSRNSIRPRTGRRSSNAGADRTIALPGDDDAGRHGDRRRTAVPAGAAFERVEPCERSGDRDVLEPGVAESDGDFPAAGTYVLRLTVSDSVLTSTDDVTFVVTLGARRMASRASTSTTPERRALRDARAHARRSDGELHLGNGGPGGGVGANNFSVRWTGRVQAPVTGSYRFSTVSDDGIRLWVNGQQVINNWTDHSATTNTSAAIALTAGVKYTITLEFYEEAGDATARLQWSYPGQATQIIPQSRLFQ